MGGGDRNEEKLLQISSKLALPGLSCSERRNCWPGVSLPAHGSTDLKASELVKGRLRIQAGLPEGNAVITLVPLRVGEWVRRVVPSACGCSSSLCICLAGFTCRGRLNTHPV
ncbi:unnamed protein product [Leuciscus chuanchicus]